MDYDYDSETKMVTSTATTYQKGTPEFYTYTYNLNNTITRFTCDEITEYSPNLAYTFKTTVDFLGSFIVL